MLQPIHSAIALTPAPNSGNRLARQHASASLLPPQPRFGNLSYMAERFFQPITENYLWGFMAQDVLGLWIPRIYTSLDRGRIPYDPQKDPYYGKRTIGAQKRHEWLQTIKGLNYWNGFEETAREVQNGPGIFIGQGILYAAAGAYMFGKRGLLIGYNDIPQYMGMLKHVLTPEVLTQLKTLPQGEAHQTLTRAYSKHIIEHHFKQSNGLGQTIHLPHGFQQSETGLLSKGEHALLNWLKQVSKAQKTPMKQLTYQQALSHWVSRYVPILAENNSRTLRHKQLVPLENAMEELVLHFNNHVLGASNPSELDHFLLPKAGKNKAVVKSSIREVLNTLEKFSTVMDELIRVGKSGPIFATGAGAANAGKTAKLLHYFERYLIQQKMPLSIIATILGSIVVTYTAILSQSTKRKYPANRLIPIPEDKDQRLKQLFASQQTMPLHLGVPHA